ncbi:YggS family pyridoxal phosphate-dependent enzyme [Desulfurobacterium indicum]|uniref:Pyridoxal phosphate homeostasis protein n=1 Tax=Desulfurobacterium indicum TaxID=1914305 RepID=A0A1R1MLJ9_9BACT|nr:YggS family pyridoxal phosphate-dependent enzyme [Desulfurobacterium indicum]OMH40629.1 YggS family pyridoxal phosphate enzyme [Desulfurobacterium indicum]
MGIKENLMKIQEKITKAAERAGRKPEEITLLAASKTRTPQEIREAFNAGIKVFGENRVQEARDKIPALSDLPIEWHFIGHLQKNKAKYVVKMFELIHSVDSKALVEELQKRADKENKIQKVLIEVKLSPEETKHGCKEGEVPELIDTILSSPNLQLLGFMTIPPYFENAEDVRPYFQRLRNIKEKMEEEFKRNFPHLSMGMSHDFEIAVEEGATIVRIGTALFGPRNY